MRSVVLPLIATCAMLFIPASGIPAAERADELTVSAPGLTIVFNKDGGIIGCSLGAKNTPRALAGGVSLQNCSATGAVTATRLDGGALEFSRTMTDAAKHVCIVTDRFTPMKDSIRWEMTVVNKDAPWTTPLEFWLKTPATAQTRFWTPWVNGAPQGTASATAKKGGSSSKTSGADNWTDPLTPAPLMNHTWDYGNGVGTICIPIASVLEPETDLGLSLALSPEQLLLHAQLSSNTDGTILFRHRLLRLGGGREVKFTADLAAHEADWRGGLRWMVDRYPDYFNPRNPAVEQLAGCGAYSHHQGELDVARLKKMGFRVNWISSFEWPFFGMYLPPVPSWKSAGHDNRGKSVPELVKTVSYQSMNDYARSMKEKGFFALNYFNVTEFGSNLRPRSDIKKDLAPADWWTDATTYLYQTMPHSIFLNSSGRATTSWSTATVIDCGDPAAQKHLIEQARRNVEQLPDSPGVCIDRMDWLVKVNFAPGADDQTGWYEGRSGRFLGLSWIDTLSKIGPIMHAKGRVIFANPCKAGHRVDLFREVDGIYDEFGDNGHSLNGSCLIALRKPAVMWTYGAKSIKPDPDSYFQRHLYMGAYPTAPFPGNDHTILPDAKLEQYYLDYGPLLDKIRGKKWALEPHCLEVAAPSSGAKANLFQVPAGYALPVTFGGSAKSATVRVRNLKGLGEMKCEALHPGAQSAVPVPSTLKDGVLELSVPLKRGCAMAFLRK